MSATVANCRMLFNKIRPITKTEVLTSSNILYSTVKKRKRERIGYKALQQIGFFTELNNTT